MNTLEDFLKKYFKQITLVLLISSISPETYKLL